MSSKLFERLYSKTLNFLSYKSRTKKEVVDRLYQYTAKRKETPEELTEVREKVLNELELIDLINDEKYVEQYCESLKYSNKVISKKAIRQKLMKKGIHRDLIDQCLSDLGHDFELEAALKDIQKKTRNIQNLPEQSKMIFKKKLYTYLSGKGYSYDVINTAIDTYSLLK